MVIIIFNQNYIVWNQSRTDQLNALDKLTLLFKKYFPNKVIYPTLGIRIQILSIHKLKNTITII